MRYAIDPELAGQLGQLPTLSLDDVSAARRQLTALLGAAPVAELDGLEIEEREVPPANGAPAVRVRTYVPPAGTGPRPGVLFMHSGGFVLGDLDVEHEFAARLAIGAEAVVVSVEYRLAPEHPYPAGLEDCQAALGWIADPASGLGVDPDRIAVAGHSAGGALAAGLCLAARDRGGPAICFQLLESPVLDDRLGTFSAIEYTDTPVWNRQKARQSWRYYIDGQADRRYAAPARAEDLSGLPPTYLATAQFDPLRDEGLIYGFRLLEASVATELRSFPGTFHGSWRLDAPVSARQMAAMVEALRRALHGHGGANGAR